MQKCAVCQNSTDKCCSLCRKVFYCSQTHQEVHWYSIHRFACEGRQQTNEQMKNQFQLYPQSNTKVYYNTVKNEQEAKIFLELFEERLILRKNVMTKFLSMRQTGNNLPKEVIVQCLNLNEISKKVTESYKSSISNYLEEIYGLITNPFIIKMDELLDKVMLARCYQSAFMIKEAKQTLIMIGSETQTFPAYVSQDFSETYKKLLTSIIDAAETANLDKVTEKMYANFIKLTEQFDGIWEQIYAYFNFGIWYARKTYYKKAVKCFSYALEMVISHKLSKDNTENSIIFKADLNFNIGICQNASNERQLAAESMQEAYRLRVQGLGKNSIQCSECLLILSKWCLEQKQYQSCLQYIMECLRVRRANPLFVKELEEVNKLILQIYEIIKKQKEQSQQQINPKTVKYFDKLLEHQQQFASGNQNEKKQSFSQRLFQNNKQYITFKLVVTPELADTFSVEQWHKMQELVDLIDKKVQKQEAITKILESNFALSLNESQRDSFIKLNRII